MNKKSDTPSKKNNDKSKSVTPSKKNVPLDKLSEILNIPEKELKKLPNSVIERILKVSHHQESYFEGPLPPPALVGEYEQILPGSFDRILKMAEENAKHRIDIDRHEIEIEKTMIPESLEIQKSGQAKAFYIYILGIIAVSFCAYINQTTIGSILAGTTLISLVPNFIAGIKKKIDKPNNQDKDDS